MDAWHAVLTGKNARYHFLEALECGLDIGTAGYIVFDIVDERRKWYASWIGGGILAIEKKCVSKLLCSVLLFESMFCFLDSKMKTSMPKEMIHTLLQLWKPS